MAVGSPESEHATIIKTNASIKNMDASQAPYRVGVSKLVNQSSFYMLVHISKLVYPKYIT